jgi:hypothetical protein
MVTKYGFKKIRQGDACEAVLYVIKRHEFPVQGYAWCMTCYLMVPARREINK